MKGLRHILMVTLASVLVFSSCVHEWPEDPAVDPTIIDVAIRLLPSAPMGLYPNGNDLVETSTPNEDLAARYYIELYSSAEAGFPIDRGTLVYADTLVCDPVMTESPVELDLRLNALHYKMVVWQDLVDAGDPESDRYWSVPSMTAVGAPSSGSYHGCDDHKMAQAAAYEFDLTPHYRKWNVRESIDIPLCKPLSKFVIVADDVAEFIKSYKANYNVDPGVSAADIISSCSFRISYVGYMITGYNAFRDKMNNSEGGYSFATEPAVLDDGSALICFDYMLTGPDTKVTLKLDAFDSDGFLINSISNIDVPLVRSNVTVVRGNFLTKDYGGGIGIDPGFEGEIDVYI